MPGQRRGPLSRDAVALIFATLAATGVDYLHVTSRDATVPAFGGDAGPTLAGLTTRYGGVPVIATGKLADPEKAERLIRSGDATMVAPAKGALANMVWPH